MQTKVKPVFFLPCRNKFLHLPGIGVIVFTCSIRDEKAGIDVGNGKRPWV